MPADHGTVQNYLKTSHRLKKMKEWYTHDYSKYLPYIVDHKRDTKKLFCRLTKTKLNKIPQEVEKHWNGKRFQRLKAEYDLQISQRMKRKLSSEGKTDADDADQEDESLRYFESILADEVSPEDEEQDEDEVEETISDKDSISDLIGSDHENDDAYILRRVREVSPNGGSRHGSHRMEGSNGKGVKRNSSLKSNQKRKMNSTLRQKSTLSPHKRRKTVSSE